MNNEDCNTPTVINLDNTAASISSRTQEFISITKTGPAQPLSPNRIHAKPKKVHGRNKAELGKRFGELLSTTDPMDTPEVRTKRDIEQRDKSLIMTFNALAHDIIMAKSAADNRYRPSVPNIATCELNEPVSFELDADHSRILYDYLMRCHSPFPIDADVDTCHKTDGDDRIQEILRKYKNGLNAFCYLLLAFPSTGSDARLLILTSRVERISTVFYAESSDEPSYESSEDVPHRCIFAKRILKIEAVDVTKCNASDSCVYMVNQEGKFVLYYNYANDRFREINPVKYTLVTKNA